jgi:cell division protein ZapA (FtsZ GTPase activity inhibitor)
MEVTNFNVSCLLIIAALLAIQDVLQKAQKFSDSMDEVQMKADMLRNNVENELRPRLEQLSSDFQVNAVINHSKFLIPSKFEEC